MATSEPVSGTKICEGLTVLVADDFESMRMVMTNQLHSLGVKRVFSASNGSEALRILQDQRIDLVLTDWNMPVMTGLALLNAMRSNPRLSHVPVVMVTGEAERQKVMEAIARGVSSVLLKPYSLAQLVDRVTMARKWQPRATEALAVPEKPALPTLSPPPQAIAAPTEPVKALTPSPQAQRPTLLLVDDTPDNLLLLSRLFREEYRVRLAQNGAKALEICTSDNPPDLVLLDIMMPDMDGFEVARRMREHPNSENTPVIFVTALTSADARMKGMELGAVDFVTKPIDPNILIPRVRNFIRYVQLRKNLQADYDNMLDTARLREDVERITHHDLKGPLAGVLGLLQNLIDQNSLDSAQRAQLCLAEKTTLEVLNMVNRSVELFKIETGTFKLEAVDVPLTDILQRIVQINAVTFAEKYLVVTLPGDTKTGQMLPQVRGDAMLCYSLFENLIKNACEAAPLGSTVSIQVLDQSPLGVVIKNTGTVPAEIRDRFFDKFVTQGKSGGTGLGTYSAKLLAQAQHGNITLAVDDDLNTTTVQVNLPRAP